MSSVNPDDKTIVPGADTEQDNQDSLASSQQQKFLDEARIVASLDHPHIVPVHDVGQTSDGNFYSVSKLIDGSNLPNAWGLLDMHGNAHEWCWEVFGGDRPTRTWRQLVQYVRRM